jgi:hypothetical protein
LAQASERNNVFYQAHIYGLCANSTIIWWMVAIGWQFGRTLGIHKGTLFKTGGLLGEL